MWTIEFINVFQGPGPPDRPMGGMAWYILLAALLLILAIMVILLRFFPKLEKVRQTENLQLAIEEGEATAETEAKAVQDIRTVRGQSIDVALRMLEPEEKRVVEALMKAGGIMLQKDISRELGLSRVKTHRVLVKLLRRGVVTAEKYYNTNRIKLADWLKTR
ncbi:MAG: hypothetical protein QW231_03445 [Candidatus Bathyarchaeia archaeon]